MSQAAKYSSDMYRPALKVSLKQPGQTGSEVFICEGCDNLQALIKKYLLAHQQLFPQSPTRAEDYCFQFGRAVHGSLRVIHGHETENHEESPLEA
jgi:hypothetical protein